MNRLQAIEEAERLNSDEDKPKDGQFEIVYNDADGEWSTQFVNSTGSVKNETESHTERVDADAIHSLPQEPAVEPNTSDEKTPTLEEESPDPADRPETEFKTKLDDGKVDVHTKHDTEAKGKNR